MGPSQSLKIKSSEDANRPGGATPTGKSPRSALIRKDYSLTHFPDTYLLAPAAAALLYFVAMICGPVPVTAGSWRTTRRRAIADP